MYSFYNSKDQIEESFVLWSCCSCAKEFWCCTLFIITTGEEGTWQSMFVISISLGIIKISAWKKYSKLIDDVLHWTLSTIWNCKKGSESFARHVRMCPMLEIYFQSLDWVQNDLCALHCASVVEYCKAAVQWLLLDRSLHFCLNLSMPKI